MAQQVKVLSARTDDLRVISRSHMAERSHTHKLAFGHHMHSVAHVYVPQ